MTDAAGLTSRRPQLLVTLCVLATLLAVACCFRFRPQTSIEGLLDPSDPAVHALGQVLNRFPVVEELLILVTLPDDATANEAALAAFAKRLTTAAQHDEAARQAIASVTWQAPEEYTRFVTDLVVPNAIYYLDDPAHQAAMQRLTHAGMDAQLARTREAMSLPGPAAGGLGKARAKTDPLNLNEFILPQLAKMLPGGGAFDMSASTDPAKLGFYSADRRSLLIRVAGTQPPSDLTFCHRITDVTQRLIDEANTDGLRVDVAGAYAVASYTANAIRHDAIVGVNGSIIGIGLLFLLLYRRSLRMFCFAFLPMAMGIAFGFGMFALFKPDLTPLAAVVGGALGGIGIDYLIFYLVHHDQDRAATADRAAAIRATSARLRGSLLTAWLTSVVGFLAVAWSPIHVLRDFALLGTLALGGAYLAATFLLPAALATFDRTTRPLATTRVQPVVRPLGRFIARRPIGVLSAAGLVLAISVGYLAVAGRSLTPASDLLLLHPRPNPPIDAQRHIAQRMGISPGFLQIYLRADSPDQLLSLAHDVERRLGNRRLAEAGFTGSFSIATVLPDPARSVQRREAIDPALPTQIHRDFVAAVREAGFNLASYARYAVFLQRLVTPDAPPAIETLAAYPEIGRMVLASDAIQRPADARDALCLVFFDNPLEWRQQRDAAIDALNASLDGVEQTGNGSVVVTGMAVVGSHVDAAIRRDLPILTLAAAIWIAFCHALHFRSVGLALLSMVPTVISAAAVLTFMSVADQPLNLVNMVMVPLLLGIDTDYGILTVSAYQSANGSRRRLLRAFPASVSAILTCACTTVIGFGSLVLVSIPAVQSLGWLINVGILACFLGTIVCVWPILFLMARRR